MPQEGLSGIGSARDDPRPLSAPAVQQARGLELRSSGRSGNARLLVAWLAMFMVKARKRLFDEDVYLICNGTVWFTMSHQEEDST